ncbi:MAG: hypothetical protein AVDCRST_MAG13-444, partial [uncultured Solirubrobacteraceae bacterium]
GRGGSRRHHLLHLGRRRGARAVPRDPVHARGVRRGGAAGGGGGRGDDPRPRAHAGRDAELRGGGLPGHHRGHPGGGRRRHRQLLHGHDRRPARDPPGLPARAAPGRGRAEHGLDELRQVLARPQGLRLRHGLREPVRGDRRARHGARGARHQAGVRVLRPRARRLARPARRHGPAPGARARGLRHGRHGRDPAHGAQPRRHGRQPPRGRALGGHRDRPAPVAAARRGPGARRVDPGGAGGQLLPPGRRDGPLQRRAGRAGPGARAGRGPPARHGGRGPGAARAPGAGRGGV